MERRGAWAVVRVLGGVLGVLTVVTGCGSAEQESVAAVAEQFYAAVHAQDGQAACVLLATSTRSALEESTGKRCAAAVLEEDVPDVRGAPASAVFGTMAQVRYPGETAFLTRVDTTWKVLAAACGDRPQGRERPYDCTVKGD